MFGWCLVLTRQHPLSFRPQRATNEPQIHALRNRSHDSVNQALRLRAWDSAARGRLGLVASYPPPPPSLLERDTDHHGRGALVLRALAVVVWKAVRSVPSFNRCFRQARHAALATLALRLTHSASLYRVQAAVQHCRG